MKTSVLAFLMMIQGLRAISDYKVDITLGSQHAELGKKFTLICTVKTSRNTRPVLVADICFHNGIGKKWCLQHKWFACSPVTARDDKYILMCNDTYLKNRYQVYLTIKEVANLDMSNWWCSVEKKKPHKSKIVRVMANPAVLATRLSSISKHFNNLNTDIIKTVVKTVEMLQQRAHVNFTDVKHALSAVNSIMIFGVTVLHNSEIHEMTQRLVLAVDGLLRKASSQNDTFTYIETNIAVSIQNFVPKNTPGMMVEIAINKLTRIYKMTVHTAGRPDSINRNIISSLVLPKYLFNFLYQVSGKNNKVVFTAYMDAALFFDLTISNNHTSRQINSVVLGANIAKLKFTHLTEEVLISFVHINQKAVNPQCVYWSYKEETSSWGWLSDGCKVIHTGKVSTICACKRLAHYALLADLNEEPAILSTIKKGFKLYDITYIGCCVSVVAHLITVISIIVVRKLHEDVPTNIIMNLSLALIATNVFFVFGVQAFVYDDEFPCKIVAGLIHFFSLSAITWMAVEVINMYLSHVVMFVSQTKHLVLKYMCFGWGIPLITGVVTGVYQLGKNYGFLPINICWISNPMFYFSFVAPGAFMVLMIIIFVVLIQCQIIRKSGGVVLDKSSKAKIGIRSLGDVIMTVLIGLTFTFAVYSITQRKVIYYYLFAIFNSLHGLFALIFYCIIHARKNEQSNVDTDLAHSKSASEVQHNVVKNVESAIDTDPED